MLCRIDAASPRDGSKKKISPSNGFGAKPTEPETMPSITDSPSARAVASTVPATSAGRADSTAIFQKVRQRLTPSASEPSSQLRGTDRRPSAKIAIMIGEIITVRITTAASRL